MTKKRPSSTRRAGPEAGRAGPAGACMLPWQSAAGFAAQRHAAQFRRDGRTPYFAHPCRVALTLSVVFGCTDQTALAAALLHDTIEDTATDHDDLHERFGGEVAAVVSALTKLKVLPEGEREREYDRRLSAADWRARLIKLADQYDNLSDALECRATGAAGVDVGSTLAKARRALTLAEVDSERPEFARARAALEGLMARAEAQAGDRARAGRS